MTWTASTLHLGYAPSCLLFAVVIVVPALANWRSVMNPILAFWFAYVITRPLGASVADYLEVTRAHGGAGWGSGLVALAMTLLILAFVAYLALTRTDVQA